MPSFLPAAASSWGPALCAAGAASLVLGAVVHGIQRRPTILPPNAGDAGRAPTVWERLSVHLVVYPVWALLFGATIWRGVPAGMIDVRFPFERQWPVWEPAEWIYLSVYFVPTAMPWLAPTRAALRRYALNLWWLLLIAVACFWLLPFGSPPREFVPTSLAGTILAWETRRADFAAASLPSFHVFWGLLVAQLVAARGQAWAWGGRAWALTVALACIANGAHALADVAASLVVFALFASDQSPLARWLQAAADRFLFKNTNPNASTRPAASPPRP